MKTSHLAGITTIGIGLLVGSQAVAQGDSFFDIFLDAGECRYSAAEIEETFEKTLAAERIDVSRTVLNSALRDAMSKIRRTENQDGEFTIRGCSSGRELCYTLVFERDSRAHR